MKNPCVFLIKQGLFLQKVAISYHYIVQKVVNLPSKTLQKVVNAKRKDPSYLPYFPSYNVVSLVFCIIHRYP